MNSEQVYLMRDAKQALLFVQDLGSECPNLAGDLGVITVMNDNEETNLSTDRKLVFRSFGG